MKTLNQQIAEILNNRPTAGLRLAILELRQQLKKQPDGEDHAECWEQYIDEGDYFPAGGLWFSYQDWLEGRTLASPDNVAYMLGHEGDLPPDQEALV